MSDLVTFQGRLHAVCNDVGVGVWLISLEHKDALPFLAFEFPTHPIDISNDPRKITVGQWAEWSCCGDPGDCREDCP